MKLVRLKAAFMGVAAAVLAVGAAFAAPREGDLDVSFSSDGLVTYSIDTTPTKWEDATALVPRPNKAGYFLVGRVYETGDIVIVALDNSGSVDTSFGVSGRVIFGEGLLTLTAVTQDNLGRIIVVGNSRKPGATLTDTDPVVCRFTAFGFSDAANFGGSLCHLIPVDKTPNGADYATSVTTDGGRNIYIAGQAQFSAEDYDFMVMKVSPSSGALVNVFGNNGIGTYAFDVDSVHAGGDTDGATSIVSDGGINLIVGGYASNEAPFGLDYAFAKIDIFSGAYVTTFCPNSGACPLSEVLAGRRTVIHANPAGNDDERVMAMTRDPDGNVVVLGQEFTYPNGVETEANEVRRLDPVSANFLGSTYIGGNFRYNQASSVITDTSGNVFIGGTTSASAGTVGNPTRVLYVTKLFPNLTADANFTTFLGANVSTSIVVFGTADANQPTEHIGGQLLYYNGNVHMAGGRLYRRDIPNNIFDYDMAAFRLAGDRIFSDGLE